MAVTTYTSPAYSQSSTTELKRPCLWEDKYKIENLPAWIYTDNQPPNNIQDCEAKLSSLNYTIRDIELQIEIRELELKTGYSRHGNAFDFERWKVGALKAKQELISCKKDQAALIKSWNAGPESLQYRLDEIQRKYVKRYNKLMEDHYNEERRLLASLREALRKEFEHDYWDKAISRCKSDLVCLYLEYRKIKNEASRPKETPAN